jgi:protein arginine kinase
MLKWYQTEAPENDVAVSVRIRFARNIEGYPFPNIMTAEQKQAVINDVSKAILEGNSAIADDFKLFYMDKISRTKAFSMAEQHLISPDFAQNGQGRALLLNSDESVSIMINEEDHIRIQVMAAGLSFKKAFDTANKIDTLCESNLRYAFDKNLGFLTECPTNLGTGMRASVMLHLPAIEAMGTIGQLAATVSKLGLTLRGTYGEGSGAKCSMYQLSNQVTLGISETEAIENLQNITNQIIERERQARGSMDKEQLEDNVYRALGLLSFARLLSGDEFMNLISRVRLGVGMGIIKDVTLEKITELIWSCQAATLQETAGVSLDSEARDKLRAKTVRENLFRKEE